MEKLVASADLATVQPVGEHELKDAILELQRSTEAISKQIDSLRQQHEAVSRLVNSNRKDRDARASLEARQLQTWEAKRRSILSAVGPLRIYRGSRRRLRRRSGWADGVSRLRSCLRVSILESPSWNKGVVEASRM